MHVREQNAAILLRWQNDEMISIESFELSARNEAVMTTVGRLRHTFPGPTMVMHRANFEEPGLQELMAQTISTMSHQPVAGTKPKVKKAGQEHDEDRDTTHPKMVTEFLMSTLRPRCTDISTAQIQKNTREEVMWPDCRSPWRRSALWFLVRVLLQLTFYRSSIETNVGNLYKQFMVFFMATIVDKASTEVSSEDLFLMNAKIARRLLKLDLAEEPAWFASVQETLSQTNSAIQEHWSHLRSRNSHIIDKAQICGLDFRRDTQCPLPGLDLFLENKGNPKKKHQGKEYFQPQPNLINYPQTELPEVLDSNDSDYNVYNLAAFENWVASDLNTWLDVHQGEEETCGQLGTLMARYFEKASSSYLNDPEATSTMLLTLLELWIACDKSAIHIHETLSEYDPCIPIDCFQSLLLSFRSHMERLAVAEEYFSRRHARLHYRGPKIFQEFGTSTCFAARYFEASHEHQQLLVAIEEDAARRRLKKKSELQEKQQRYRELMALASRTECRYVEVIVDKRHDLRETVHSGDCPREDFEEQAESIEISVHEWPLPTNRFRAKSTVFELQVPEPFGSWRDTTVFFLHSCLNLRYAVEQRPRAEYRPDTYQGLSSFFRNNGRNQRICLLSQDKPHERTHRRDRLIVSVTENDVCVSNGLHSQYFDNALGCFVGDFERSHQTEKSCTYRLPAPSSALQQFLFRPAKDPHGPTPNTVIATQSDAPDGISLEEYKALAIMPLGLEIQWQNILLELAMPSVDMKKAETTIFMLQIINQAGPSKAGTAMRQGHAILSQDAFTIKLLCQIKEAMERIKENWESIYGLHGLIRLVRRLRYDAEWILESRKFLVSNWCSILRFACSQNPCPNKFQFTTWLVTVAFSSDADMAALETIISFFVTPELNSTHPPTSELFLPMQGADFISTAIRHEILSEQLHVTPESNLKPNKDENAQIFKSRKARLRSKNRKAALEDMLHHLESQWPTRSPTSPSNRRIYDYLNVQRIMIQISKLFNEWYDNRELKQYISDIANVICHQLVEEVEVQPYLPPQPSQTAPVKRGFITFDEMLRPHSTIAIEEPQLEKACSPSFSSKLPPSKFVAFLNSLSLQAKSNYEKKYVEQLEDSFLSLQNMRQDDSIDLAHESLKNIILKYLASCHVYANRMYRALVSQLLPFEKTSESGAETHFRRRIAATALELRQYPRLSPVLFLEQLSRHRWDSLDTDWKKCFIAYGCSITKLQRAKRLAGLLNDRDDLLKEIRNPGHTNWQPIRFPETLLLEIENDILVRENQEEIAATMRHIVPGQNSVMQLNMGEGKSSEIAPMVVANLANGSCLVRVLVAKPQSRQMFQMLVTKLGGLLGRRVYHMPVSRALKLGKADAEEIERTCQECMSQGGVLLVQPEHILSLKLMSLECLIAGKRAVGRSLLRTLHFFQHSSQDIVDESDANFSVKFELIYTMGCQCPTKFSPQRWTVLQELLHLVRYYARRVHAEFPDSIEVN